MRHDFTFDSTQDISRDPVIIDARKRHFENERIKEDIRKTVQGLHDEGYHDLAMQYQSIMLAVYVRWRVL